MIRSYGQPMLILEYNMRWMKYLFGVNIPRYWNFQSLIFLRIMHVKFEYFIYTNDTMNKFHND